MFQTKNLPLRYGFNNKSIEAKIHIEVEDLAKHLVKENGAPVDPFVSDYLCTIF